MLKYSERPRDKKKIIVRRKRILGRNNTRHVTSIISVCVGIPII